MLDKLNNGTDVASILDVDVALRFIVLNVLTGNMDSYLGQNKHNYYLYEDDGIFNVMPWDYNMAFGGLGGTGLLIDEPTSGTLTDRPLVAKLLAVDEYKEVYHNILSEAIEGYLSENAIAARVQEIRDMISAYVKADPSAFYTYDEYEKGITSVLAFNKTQTTNISQQLAGTIPSSGDGSGSGTSGMGGGRGFGGNRPAALNGSDIAAQGDSGMFPPDGQMPDQQDGLQVGFGGQRPDGQGGMGGGMDGGFGGSGTQAAQAQGSPKEAATAGIALVVLLLSCAFVVFYKRKRL
ncbi:CotH kinase family protein [Paenibacillus sp. Soil522]|uniref:CotH kinase family protein n=1 Tax=Paenibacillus sp. Soil522 TaxID=1736388 RepID=UPI0007012889|nr:CotH kinase family protein [Paenibacillus sp. Soil522]KRE46916.1 hypothetical protein ASG81_10630 [Paenibacillus sp. Soil522]